VRMIDLIINLQALRRKCGWS